MSGDLYDDGLFASIEARSGLALIAAAALALAIANSPIAPAYFAALSAHLGPLSVLHWINDALMSLFFLAVGLEVKRELLAGELADPAARTLPVIAAAAGMIVPALVYLAVTRAAPATLRGWAIPAATDIAFAQGMLALAGRGMPPALRLFLTTVAIVDDIGAVAIIALGYTPSLNLVMLGAAALVLGAMILLARLRVGTLWPYLLLAVALWIAVLGSGIHATVAGVVAALTIPLEAKGGRPLERLEHGLHPIVAFGIVPLFGFANAGLSLGGLRAADLIAPLPLGIAAALFLGKQAGVLGGTAIAVRLGLARLPAGARWRDLYAIALLCGIGFTMSLFIGGLAFATPGQENAVKLGVLAGSCLSALAGCAMLSLAGASRRR